MPSFKNLTPFEQDMLYAITEDLCTLISKYTNYDKDWSKLSKAEANIIDYILKE